MAIPLLEGIQTSALLADKGYDTNELRAWLKARGIEVVIPPKSNRKEHIDCDFWQGNHYVRVRDMASYEDAVRAATDAETLALIDSIFAAILTSHATQ